MDNDIMSKLPESIQKNLDQLYFKSQLGLLPLIPRDATNRRRSAEMGGYNHANIKIPYAGKVLKWEVVFDVEDFNFPPNFYFHDDTFLNDPDEDLLMKEVPSLIRWNQNDPASLTKILSEFLDLYKRNQIDKLKKENIYSRFYEEYELLVTENGADMVEVSIDGITVTFFVALKINCSDLPKYIQDGPMEWCNPGEDFAHLKITITNVTNSRYNFFLQLSPHLEQVLGNMRNLKIPDLKKDSTIIEYVLAVNRIINDRIETVASHFKLKKEFVLGLVSTCWETLIDYDSESLDKVCFLHKVEDYMCLVTVTIGPRYPTEKPFVRLTSIYCQEGRNCNDIIDKYPYNPAQTPEMHIKKLLEYLKEAMERLKNHQH